MLKNGSTYFENLVVWNLQLLTIVAKLFILDVYGTPGYVSVSLTYFMPLVSFYTSWKHQKIRFFDQWNEIG